MAYVVGTVLAGCVSLLARRVGFDRDRSFYPTVLVVIASYYVLFAVVGGSAYALITESIIMTVFVVVAVCGFKRNLWIVAGGLAGHGILTTIHRADALASHGHPTGRRLRWAYQLKFDGYRAIAFKASGKVDLRSRNDDDSASGTRPSRARSRSRTSV